VQEFVDVGADIETTYDQFTQFEDWPQFMHRVERVEQRDDTTLMMHENIWGVRRSWEAEITEQTPCERIVYRSKSDPKIVGVVTFHRLSDTLTRVQVNMDFQPQGLFEKTASGMRMSRRALRSDLMRFKAFVEMRDEATGEWRGQIEDGEVVDSTAEEDEEEQPEAEEDEEDQPEAEEDEEDQPEAEEDEEEQPRSRKGRRFKRDESEESDEDFADEDEDEDDEPTSEASDEADEEDEEPEPAPKKPRSRRRASTSTRAAARARR
jgi:hypothetical protein